MKTLTIDTESTGLNTWLGDEAFCVGAFDEKEYYYWEWPVDPYTRKVKYKYDDDYFLLQEFLYDNQYELVFWNAKHDLRMLEKIFCGRRITAKYHEVVYMAKACNTMEPSYKLKTIACKYLDIPNTDEQDLKKQVQEYRARAKKLKLNYFLGENLEEDYWLPNNMGAKQNLCRKYNLLDVKRTYEAFKFYWEGMDQLLVRHTYEKEMRLLPVVYEMEQRGVRIDYNTLKEERSKIVAQLADTEKNCREAFNVTPDFNFNSSKQLVKLLFVDNKLPVQKETKAGGASTDVTSLKKLREHHKGIDYLLQKRGLEKGLDYLNTYDKYGIEDKLLGPFTEGNWIDKSLYRAIHANFNPWGATATGRFSCNDPNLQNVTSEETSSGENVVDARHLFVPRDGYFWFCIDYSQLELRIFASRANEETMIEAFLAGKDIHDEVRNKVTRLRSLPEKRGRKIAKNINFTVVNAGGAKVLLERYEVPLQEGKIFIKDYYETYPDVKTHQENMTREGYSQGYIRNAYNRRLVVEKDFAYRASSYDIQGSAADVMKNAMIGCSSFLKQKGVDCHMVMSIHDELVFECNKKCATKTLLRSIKEIMEDHKGVFQVPLPVEVSMVSKNWRKKQKVEL